MPLARPTKVVILTWKGLTIGEAEGLVTDDEVTQAIEDIYKQLNAPKGWQWKSGMTNLGNIYRSGKHGDSVLEHIEIIVGEKL
jgi:hypothetical protein